MLNWAKNTLGVTEPIYGPSAIQPVTQQAAQVPFSELKKEDMKWEVMSHTNVETQTFYFNADGGQIGLVQVIYSNVMGVRTTAQFSSKIISKDPSKPHLWSTDNLKHYSFSDDRYNFKGDKCSLDLSADGKTYHIKSHVNSKSTVDLKFTQVSPGFVVGKNGTSFFGTDPKDPWGRMRHAFWPRCKVEGVIITPQGPIDLKGRGIFIHALQGMKPHHAAARWNFANFQSPTYSAIMMEFTTPPSYGSTVVNVSGIATDNGIMFANGSGRAKHENTKTDAENAWPEPTAADFQWSGTGKDGKHIEAQLKGSLGPRIDRVDVMGELPKFVKQIATSASGTKPYIYQFLPKMTLRIKDGESTKEEEGQLFMEATFIS